MPWLEVLALALGFALGVAVGRAQGRCQPPRLRFYPHAQTGQALRRKLFGGEE